MKAFKNSTEKNKIFLVLIIVVGVILLLLLSSILFKDARRFVYSNNLDMTVVEIAGNDISLKNITYYIMIEEESVDESARAYNPENPLEYWNVNVSNRFVSSKAREVALDFFIHDYIFSILAAEDGIELTEDEEKDLGTKANTIFEGLTEKQLSTGITREDIIVAVTMKTYADKYILKEAKANNVKMDEEVLSAYYGINSTIFKKLKKDYNVKVNDRNLEKIPMGHVTIN